MSLRFCWVSNEFGAWSKMRFVFSFPLWKLRFGLNRLGVRRKYKERTKPKEKIKKTANSNILLSPRRRGMFGSMWGARSKQTEEVFLYCFSFYETSACSNIQILVEEKEGNNNSKTQFCSLQRGHCTNTQHHFMASLCL